MEIITGNKKIQHTLNQAEMQELLVYFQALKEPVILREIRKAFPRQKHLDKNLDFLINHEIISRQDRRYCFGLQIVEKNPTSEMVEHFLEENSDDYSAEQLLVWLGEKAWGEAVEKTLAIDFPLAVRNHLENERFRLVTINRGGELQATLPNYFAHVEQPALFPQLAQLVGDVNPEFFTNQIGLILERVLADRAPRRESIFLKSLLASEVIVSQPEWRMAIPVYEEDSALDWTQEMDSEARFFFGRQLAERLLDKRESFTYLIKKKA